MTLETISTITGLSTSVVTLIGVPFLIYTMWIKGQKADGERITSTEKQDLTIGSRIDLIALEVKHLTEAFLLVKQNDLHSIYEKQRDHDHAINNLAVAVEKLTTIIEERVPRKTVKEVS